MFVRRPLVRLVEFFVDQLAPRHCPGCDREHAHEGAFCADCELTLGAPVTTACDSGLDAPSTSLPVRALGAYRPPLSMAIRRIKYQERADLVAPLAGAWLDAQRGVAAVHADHLVPVPLHPRRLVARGFNQSALIAEQLASRLAIPAAPRLLRKVIETPHQASLGREQRRKNLTGAFTTDRRFPHRGQKVVLVDDVVTTGETARACIRALARANLRVVEIWALAHTPIDSHP